MSHVVANIAPAWQKRGDGTAPLAASLDQRAVNPCSHLEGLQSTVKGLCTKSGGGGVSVEEGEGVAETGASARQAADRICAHAVLTSDGGWRRSCRMAMRWALIGWAAGWVDSQPPQGIRDAAASLAAKENHLRRAGEGREGSAQRGRG